MYRISRIKLSAGTIFWQETGRVECPPVLFLHGSWGDSYQWQYIMQLLGKHFHCLAPDLPGFGDSIAVRELESIEERVELLHEWLQALKIESIQIVGHSLGAWVGCSFALRYPEMVAGLVVISPEGMSQQAWHREYPKIDRWLLARPWLLKATLATLQALAPLLEEVPYFKPILHRWQRLRAFPATTRLFLSRSPQAISQDSIASRLQWLRVPTRVLQTTRDDDTTINQSKAFADAIPDGDFRWLDNPPHLPPHKLSRQVAKQVYIFVLRVERAKEDELSSLW
jgi:pimeloyl-ACP methyl ester carboxylesterase